MPSAFPVLIVEDDAVIARVYTTLINAMPGFTVVGTARTVTSAMASIVALQPRLVLLDYGLPGGANGIDLLRNLRTSGRSPDVIAITAYSSTDLVRESMRLGVLDYLVKPFSEDRLRQALNKSVTVATRERASTLSQDGVDELRESLTPAKPWIPRELSAQRLASVRVLLAGADEPLSAEKVALQIQSSRVTARRYLEFLVSINEVGVTVEAERTGGRPRKLYALRSGSTGFG